MKYFFDTEFIEGFKKPIKWLPTIGKFNKPYHSIQLISIGIVCEDGRTYYAISSEFNPDDASDWVKENVLYPIMRDNGYSKTLSNLHGYLEYGKQPIKRIQKCFGGTNYQIACDIMAFTMDGDGKGLRGWDGWTDEFFKALKENGSNLEAPEFYAYYADYDWVAFCSLFGTMMDLPKGFPMYCRELKQMIDDVAAAKIREVDEKTAGVSRFEASLSLIKASPKYPEQKNEHNALDDAKWNFELYKYIQEL